MRSVKRRPPPVPDLEAAMRGRLAAGGRVFVPYVTGGLPGVDAALLQALEAAGADAVEVGIPFSDPVMDGPVIQEASRRALEAGATLAGVLQVVKESGLGIPVVAMTYLNPMLSAGLDRFAGMAVEAGLSGVIVPDLPVDEAREWTDLCANRGIATVFLAAPGSSTARLRRIASSSRGFVYCVSSYGVTGERDTLGGSARALVESLRPETDLPLLVGVGIGTPEQAAATCEFADGVVVGTALVRPLLRNDPGDALRLARAFRDATA
jgi:tryptophan synthase alpha chain